MSLPLHHTEPAERRTPIFAWLDRKASLPCSPLGVLQFSGEDAEAFLQGQLSCDVAAVGLRSSAYGPIAPQGQDAREFPAVARRAGFHMALSRTSPLPFINKLSKFVMRARVKVSDASDTIVIAGAAGRRRPRHCKRCSPISRNSRTSIASTGCRHGHPREGRQIHPCPDALERSRPPAKGLPIPSSP